MDSRSKTESGVPQAEMPAIRIDRGRAGRANHWLVGAVVVLALAVVGLAVGLILQADSSEPQPKAAPQEGAVADATITARVDDYLGAQSTHDADTMETYFTADATFSSVAANGSFDVYEARDEIWGMFSTLFAAVPDLSVERISPIFQSGDVVSFMVRDSNQTEMMWALVWRDGSIAGQWNFFTE